MHRSQSILNEIRKFFFSQKGMYKRYPLKHFGAFIVFIDRAMIEFRKQWLINRGNTIPSSFFPQVLYYLISMQCHTILNGQIGIGAGVESFQETYERVSCDQIWKAHHRF